MSNEECPWCGFKADTLEESVRHVWYCHMSGCRCLCGAIFDPEGHGFLAHLESYGGALAHYLEHQLLGRKDV